MPTLTLTKIDRVQLPTKAEAKMILDWCNKYPHGTKLSPMANAIARPVVTPVERDELKKMAESILDGSALRRYKAAGWKVVKIRKRDRR